MAVVAKNTVRVMGQRELIVEGRLYDDDDPIVKAQPGLFESPEEHRRRKQRPRTSEDLPRHRAARPRPEPDPAPTAAEAAVAAPAAETATAEPDEARSISYPCPVEGCTFTSTSERAVKTHRTKVHG